MDFLSYLIRCFGSRRNIFGFKKEKTLKELLEKDVRNSNDFLEVFNYSSEEREREKGME